MHSNLDEPIAELEVALAQVIDSDDEILIEHIKTAHAMLSLLRMKEWLAEKEKHEMKLVDMIDREQLKDCIITLPKASLFCPECGQNRPLSELPFVREVGMCEACSMVPTITRRK